MTQRLWHHISKTHQDAEYRTQSQPHNDTQNTIQWCYTMIPNVNVARLQTLLPL